VASRDTILTRCTPRSALDVALSLPPARPLPQGSSAAGRWPSNPPRSSLALARDPPRRIGGEIRVAGVIDVSGQPIGGALSRVQDRRDSRDSRDSRAGWTDGRRCRQGPMTGWSWTLAAFRGSFAVPRGVIYYRGSSRRGQSRFPRPEREGGRGAEGDPRAPENLYAECEGVVYIRRRDGGSI